jgi:hypothetical protein
MVVVPRQAGVMRLDRRPLGRIEAEDALVFEPGQFVLEGPDVVDALLRLDARRRRAVSHRAPR